VFQPRKPANTTVSSQLRNVGAMPQNNVQRSRIAMITDALPKTLHASAHVHALHAQEDDTCTYG